MARRLQRMPVKKLAKLCACDLRLFERSRVAAIRQSGDTRALLADFANTSISDGITEHHLRRRQPPAWEQRSSSQFERSRALSQCPCSIATTDSSGIPIIARTAAAMPDRRRRADSPTSRLRHGVEKSIRPRSLHVGRTILPALRPVRRLLRLSLAAEDRKRANGCGVLRQSS